MPFLALLAQSISEDEVSQMETGLPIVAGLHPAGKTAGKALPPAGKLPPTATVGSEGVRDTSPTALVRASASPSVEAMEKAVKHINELLRDRRRELEFSVDEGSGRTVVKVIHSETGEVIRQLPPDVVLRFASAFTEGSASLMEAFA